MEKAGSPFDIRQMTIKNRFLRSATMENMADAMQKMARGLVQPVIDTQVELTDIDQALERMEGRKVFGKIILNMD